MRSRYCLQQLRGAVIHTVLASLTPPELALSARRFLAYGFDARASISLCRIIHGDSSEVITKSLPG